MTVERSPPDDRHASPDELDDAFRVLRHRRRRLACYVLLEHETASLSDVADAVAGWQYATGDGIVEPQCRRQCYLDLRHTHVPVLVDAGVARYDEESETLSLAPCPEPIRNLVTKACAFETGS